MNRPQLDPGTKAHIRRLRRMEKIIAPKVPGLYVDRDIDCEEAMDYAITDLLDRASTAGWSIPEALAAIERVIPNQRMAYDADPDPADEAVQPREQ